MTDKADCDCGAEPYKDAAPCRDQHLPDCPAAQPRDDVRERKPVAWRYEYSVQYKNKLECTKNLAPLSVFSEHRWSPEEARNYSETPLYTALAPTTQGTDSGLADELEARAETLTALARDNKPLDTAHSLAHLTQTRLLLERAAEAIRALAEK